MRVHFWSADTGGSALYRCVLPGTAMQWAGHHVTVGQHLPEDWESCDVIVGARVANQEATRMWKVMKDAGIRLVLDLDDDYFHINPTDPDAYQEWIVGGTAARLSANMQIADKVTVCTKTLAHTVGNLSDNVQVIPNGLPAQHLGLPRDYRPDHVVGGWSGTRSTMPELKLAARHLNRIADRKDAHVLLVGCTPEQAREQGMRSPKVYVTGWLPKWEDYAAQVYTFDFWAAPYRDNQFNRAKFPTKALEAGFFGIPLVATALPGYEEFITHGVNGFLVPPGQEHLFGRYLKRLADDADLRQQMGEAARARASQNILQGLGPVWEAALS